MPSATTADSRDSIAPRIAMATASGSTARILARSKAGSVGAGRVRGSSPKRLPMVATSRCRRNVSAAVTATAISSPGHFGRIAPQAENDGDRKQRQRDRRRFDRMDIGGDGGDLGQQGRRLVRDFETQQSFNWLAKMMIAMPAVKPTMTGNGMYLM